ncbi:hydrogenase 4 subunit B [Telmatospirillum sp. J64-1]|uniref:hydrogenase 4 subunit B n=1 Tax=Telmatospirillum sp. J64-1 TaxID=2502183 RepID=UPI00115E5BD4|nr:hydrogenase 4 subunit B [Telmatospirillum sp. J64-1]
MTAGAALLLLLVASLVPLGAGHLARAHQAAYGLCLGSALVLALVALVHLAAGDAARLAVLPFGLPWMAAHFRLDQLSAFFLLVINLPAAMAALYGIGYGLHAPEYRRVTPFFPLFLLGMNVVVLADDAFVFLVGWEFMSLASWLLVLSNHRDQETRRAAHLYLIMASFGGFCLLPAFGLMAGEGGDFRFEAMRAGEFGPVAGFLVVLLALLGAGSKAGLVPLHAWLPQAHPAAPSHVSALMSGVMTKVALYGLVRILFDLHGAVDWRWGAALMLIGAASAVIGVLYALMQTDLKRLLAYSTVENIGVIAISLGLALAFKDQGRQALAALALVAAFYHMLNHAAFKTLLFLGAGAVQAATHERELNRLGGLIKRMPVTAPAFLLGAMAISALPPLNGFVSEWLIFQSLFRGPELPHWTMKFGVPVVGALLALAAALAAACFVRAFGIAFLGRARSAAAAQAAEVVAPMRAALVLLAVLCVVLGVIPVTVTGALATIAEPLAGAALEPAVGLGWPWLSPADGERGSYAATVLVLAGLVLAGLLLWATRRLSPLPVRVAPSWDCGQPDPSPATQYTADSFAQPLRRVFGTRIFGARETVEMPPPGDPRPARFSLRMRDPIWQGLYLPLAAGVDWLAERINRMQFLSIRRYLMLMFLTLVVLLVVVGVRQ